MIGAAVGAGVNLLSGVLNNKAAKKAAEQQQKYTLQQLEKNYEYNEMSADAAHDRSIDLQERQWGQDNQKHQLGIADWTEAGGNAAAYFNAGGTTGGGGGSSSGAQGGGASGPGGPDVAAILGAVNEKRKIGLESAIAGAQIRKADAETESIKEETEERRKLSPLEEEISKLGIEEKQILNGTLSQRQAVEIAEIMGRTEATEDERELTKALTRFNDAKIEELWQQLLNESIRLNIEERAQETKEHEAETSRINALANQLSARAAWKNAETSEKSEENPGNIYNVKTWKKLAKDVSEKLEDINIEGVLKHPGIATGVEATRRAVKQKNRKK